VPKETVAVPYGHRRGKRLTQRVNGGGVEGGFLLCYREREKLRTAPEACQKKIYTEQLEREKR